MLAIFPVKYMFYIIGLLLYRKNLNTVVETKITSSLLLY